MQIKLAIKYLVMANYPKILHFCNPEQYCLRPSKALLGCLTGLHEASLCLTGPYWDLLGLTGHHWAFRVGPYWALLGYTRPYFGPSE